MEISEILLVLIVTMIAVVLHLILHEIGHMIAGLLSGYKIIFIRFGSYTFIKEERWKLKKFNIPGTGGQCIMQPPYSQDFHYRLYFLGGVMMNVVLLIVGLLCFLCFSETFITLFGAELAYVGVCFVILNGLPLKISGIVNDGYHVFKMKDNDKMKLYAQLMIGSFVIKGISLLDIDESLFQYDCNQEGNFYDDYLINVSALRALEQDDYIKAKELFLTLLQQPKTIELYKMSAKMELMIIEAEENGNEASIHQYIDKKLIKVFKQQKYDLSALLAYYCVFMFEEHDMKKAEKIEQQFLKQKDHCIEKGTISLYFNRYKNIKEKIESK